MYVNENTKRFYGDKKFVKILMRLKRFAVTKKYYLWKR